MHADALGADALDGAPLACLGYERCAALLLPLLLPLPVAGRCGALAQLQSKLSSQLLAYLGTSLERVLESERGCQVGALRMRCACCAGVAAGRRTRVGVLLQRNERHAGRACANIGVHSPVLLPQRFCRLPFEVGHWLLEHGPCDRGETRECWWHTYLPRCVPYISHRKAAPMLATVHRRTSSTVGPPRPLVGLLVESARHLPPPHTPPPPPPPQSSTWPTSGSSNAPCSSVRRPASGSRRRWRRCPGADRWQQTSCAAWRQTWTGQPSLWRAARCARRACRPRSTDASLSPPRFVRGSGCMGSVALPALTPSLGMPLCVHLPPSTVTNLVLPVFPACSLSCTTFWS